MGTTVTDGGTLVIVRGSTWDKLFTWTNQDGAAVSLSGSPKMWFVVKSAIGDADASAVIVATYGSPTTPTATAGTSMAIVSAAAGTHSVVIAETATDDLTVGADYVWGAQLLTDGGHCEERMGKLIVRADVVQAVT